MAKKEKIIYVDDGRTLADMSNVGRTMPSSASNPYAPRASLKEQWNTYWNAVKMMFLPMLVFLAGIGVIFGMIFLLFSAV